MSTSPSEPRWLDLSEILEAHKEQIELFGGTDGVRDQSLVESALARPQNLFYWDGESDILTLAVRLGLGIAQNHGFVDGNKRTGAVSMLLFLAANGYILDMPPDTTLGVLFEAAVTDDISEAQLIEDLYPYVEAFQDLPRQPPSA